MAKAPIEFSKKNRSEHAVEILHGHVIRFLMFGILALMIPATGCQRFPANQAMRQYQLESDRLLNEFRAQKKRADELEARNAQLENRLSESEKMLALSQSGSSGRSNRTRSEPELLIGEATGSSRNSSNLSNNASSRSQPNRSSAIRPGLPNAAPPVSGRLTSGSTRDPISLGGAPRDLKGDSSRESQWRPVAGSK
jgi:hypothetical protein